MDRTKTYYVKCFTTSLMNRLVEHESNSLMEQYDVCKEELDQLDVPLHVKEQYMQNLDHAFEHVQMYINGIDDMYLVH